MIAKHLKFAPVVQEEMSFNIFLIYSSGVHFVQRSGTVCAIFAEAIMAQHNFTQCNSE